MHKIKKCMYNLHIYEIGWHYNQTQIDSVVKILPTSCDFKHALNCQISEPVQAYEQSCGSRFKLKSPYITPENISNDYIIKMK